MIGFRLGHWPKRPRKWIVLAALGAVLIAVIGLIGMGSKPATYRVSLEATDRWSGMPLAGSQLTMTPLKLEDGKFVTDPGRQIIRLQAGANGVFSAERPVGYYQGDIRYGSASGRAIVYVGAGRVGLLDPNWYKTGSEDPLFYCRIPIPGRVLASQPSCATDQLDGYMIILTVR